MSRPTTASVAAPHPEAARAGQLAIQQGGNAVDAAAAAMLTLCVVMPQQVGLGGYGGSLVLHRAKPAPSSSNVVCIDFDTVAPENFRAALYPTEQEANIGYLAVTVPAVIAGLALAVKDHGRLPFSAACQYAADLAERGFPVDATYHKQILQWSTRTDPVSRKALFPDALPQVGELWVQRDKAKLLRRLAGEGPDAFYRGDIPRTICRQVQAHGGILTENDFASYRPRYVDPLTITYRGNTVYTPPPPSGGLTTFQILKTLEHFDLSSVEPFSADYFHLFAEATKLCWQDRHATAGDPDFVNIPVAKLLSTEHAAAKAAQIRTGSLAFSAPEKPSGAHTANILVSDPDGNLVSVTATQGWLFGSTVVIDGLGVVLGHGMSRFDYSPSDSPNAPAKGKRPFHNMSPTIVVKDNQPRFAVGLPGGPKIVTVTAQLLVDLIDFHLSPAATVAAPRIHIETQEPIAASSGVTDATLRALEELGHKTVRGQTVGGPPTEIAGTANALAIDPATRIATAASQAGPTAALNF